MCTRPKQSVEEACASVLLGARDTDYPRHTAAAPEMILVYVCYRNSNTHGDCFSSEQRASETRETICTIDYNILERLLSWHKLCDLPVSLLVLIVFC